MQIRNEEIVFDVTQPSHYERGRHAVAKPREGASISVFGQNERKF
jgi:hypothetical protein